MRFTVCSPTVAANVVSKGDHTLYGFPLLVQYETPEQFVKKSKLLLTQLPSKIDFDFLKLLMEKALGTEEFSLQQQDDTSAMISFHRIVPGDGTFCLWHWIICHRWPIAYMCIIEQNFILELQLIMTKLESIKGRCSNIKVLTEGKKCMYSLDHDSCTVHVVE